MFSKFFNARFTEAKQSVQKNTKGADVKRCHLKFLYDYTPDLATCMGKRAVNMQRQLITEKDSQLTAKTIAIELDTNTVSAKIKHKNTNALVIERTMTIKADAKKPTKSSETPSIHLELISEMDGPQLDFVNDFLNEPIKIQLTRQQTEIAGTQDQDQGTE